MSGLLATAQTMVTAIVGYFSLNCSLFDSRIRDELKNTVLPFLQARFLPVTLMEKEFGDLVCIAQSDEELTIVDDGSTQPM